MKKKNINLKFVAIFTIALFMGTMIYFSPQDPSLDLSGDNKIVDFENTEKVSDVITGTPTGETINYNTWYSGETVSSDIEFNKQSLLSQLISPV